MGRTGGIGTGTIILLGLIGWALGINPLYLIGGAEILSGLAGSQQQSQPAPGNAKTEAPPDQMGEFVSVVALARTISSVPRLALRQEAVRRSHRLRHDNWVIGSRCGRNSFSSGTTSVLRAVFASRQWLRHPRCQKQPFQDSSCRSSVERRIRAPATFSSRCATDDVPGMGTMTRERAAAAVIGRTRTSPAQRHRARGRG